MANINDIAQLMQEHKFAEAIPLLEKLISNNDEQLLPNLKSRLAYCYFREEKFEQSIFLLNECLSIEPENPEYLSDRGISNFMLGKAQQSLADFDRAQELEPQNPYRYSSRAYIKDALGDIAGAITDYQKTLELDPEDAIAYNNLGILLEKQGKQKEAQSLYKKADQLENKQQLEEHPEAEAPDEPSVLGPVKAKEFTEESSPGVKPSMNTRFYFSTLKMVLTSRDGFREFLNFLMRKKSKH